ncbi:unnamed protein product [Rotaria sordida]|uniref:Peptidase M12A domain-containing protein n=1 Tax=Rotaria sordida TaxID=392033 RepID=A0A818X7Z2_9BILA|nr:unnamed protein product [Rotaria sordida]
MKMSKVNLPKGQSGESETVEKIEIYSRYQKHLSSGLFEGDIRIYQGPTTRGVALRGTGVKWPNGIVPYEIATGYAVAQQDFIVATMRLMERYVAINNTRCIQFRPRVPTDQYYITIVNGAGCSSYVDN